MKHYVRLQPDNSLRYIGQHGARPREAFGPAIPKDLLDEKRWLTYTTERDEFGEDVITLAVDQTIKRAALEAKEAEELAEETAKAEDKAERDALTAAKENLIENKERIRLDEAVQMIIDLTEILEKKGLI